MPRVPEYQPKVDLRPQFRQGVDVQGSPQAFGADTARGMGDFAKGGGVSAPDAGANEIELAGVRGGDTGFPVSLAFEEVANRPMLRAVNEGGFACTEVDLLDLIGWLHRLCPSAVDPDELACAIAVFAASRHSK